MTEGVREVHPEEGGWTTFTWSNRSMDGEVLQHGHYEVYEFLPIRERLGRTMYTHGGPRGGDSCGVISGDRNGFSIAFDDLATRHNELLRMFCFLSPEPGQIEHEMLRDIPGTRATVERCGTGYVIVSRAGRGTFAAWQVSDQSFARVDNSFDREMVTAYVDKWGSITSRDVDLSVDKWVRDEIRWRIPQLDWAYEEDRKRTRERRRVVDVIWVLVTPAFPDLFRLQGHIPEQPTLPTLWEKLHFARHWFWANLDNFRYDDGTRGYVLKGPDRHDPANPPALPEELRGPPRPEPEEAEAPR